MPSNKGYTCDRCGDVSKHSPALEIIGVGASTTLCPQCLKDFYDWIEGKI